MNGLNVLNAGNIECGMNIDRESFRIVQFSDLHMGESDDQYTLRLMRWIVSTERPDFIVFSGDQVSGYAVFGEDQRALLWQKALSVASEFGVPFATIFGNHDDQPYHLDPLLWHTWALVAIISALIAFVAVRFLDRGEKIGRLAVIPVGFLCFFIFMVTGPNPSVRISLLEHEHLTYPRLSYTAYSPPNLHGVSNYRLVLRSSNASVALYFLDTGGGWIPEAIHDDQVEWLKSFDPVPSLVFMHIPPMQYGAMYSKSNCFGPAPLETSSGCPGSDTLLQTLSDIGTIGVFVGHDHGNSWCCRSDGMLLCYGRHSGYGGYDFGGPERGARVIDLSLRNSVTIETRVSVWGKN